MDYEKLIQKTMDEVQNFNLGIIERHKDDQDAQIAVGFVLWGAGIIAKRYLEGICGKDFVNEREKEIECTFAVVDLMNTVKL